MVPLEGGLVFRCSFHYTAVFIKFQTASESAGRLKTVNQLQCRFFIHIRQTIMLQIISANVNGIRSAYKKGFYEYIAASGADIVCVQELKAQEADLSDEMKNPHGMHGHWHCAEKRGYSGVAVYSKRAPDNVQIGMGIEEFDREGRFVRCDFGKLSVISLYLPSGTSAPERQELKYRFLDAFYPMLEAMKAEGRDIVVCGDWNIAHQNIDLKNWKGNQKNSGFLPEEREWIGKVIHTLGWTDMWRTLYPDNPGYTWWSNRGQAYAKDVGWRIDYQMVTPELAAKAVSAHVYKDEKFSDHAPLVVEYDYAV